MVDLEKFNKYRKRMNERILSSGNLELKRFWAFDSRAYEAGALDERKKELLEALNVALVVGGSITIPSIRRAAETLDACREVDQGDPGLRSLL